MRIRFSPPWENCPDIDKAAAVKNLGELQAKFFNWLYDCAQGFSSKTLAEQAPLPLFKVLMGTPDVPNNYYDHVLNIVERGDKVALTDLYGLEQVESSLAWKFQQLPDKTIVASLIESDKPNCSFSLQSDNAAKKMFCAELFKFMRTKTRVVDDTFSTSTQFATHEVLTALYACHLFDKVL